MENLVLVVHLITALAIIGLILLQRGKGAEMGASFGGGSSQTLFGAAGSGNFFSRATAVCAFVFFGTSLSLAIIAKNQTEIDVDIPLPALEQVDSDIPAIDSSVDSDAESDIPAIDAEEAGSADDVIEIPAE